MEAEHHLPKSERHSLEAEHRVIETEHHLLETERCVIETEHRVMESEHHLLKSEHCMIEAEHRKLVLNCKKMLKEIILAWHLRYYIYIGHFKRKDLE